MLLQGLSPVLTKLLLEDLSQASVVAARYFLATAILMPFGIPETTRARRAGGLRGRDWVGLLLVGGLGSGLGALLFTAAVDYSSAGVASAISKTAPIFVAFFAHYTLRERVNSVRLLLVAGIVGANVLIGAGEITSGGGDVRLRLLGDALALGAGMTRALSEIVAKSALRRFAPVAVTFWRFTVGFGVAVAVALSTGGLGTLLDLNTRGLVLLAVLSLGCTALSMLLYYRGMAGMPTHVAVSLKLLGAVVTVIVSGIVLGEVLSLYHLTGIGLLISGAYILVLRTAREQPADLPDLASRAYDAGPRAQPRGVSPLATSLRWRIVAIVSAAAVAAVAGVTYLSVRHTQSVVREQTRLTMVQVATMALQAAAIESRPPPSFYRQYLERLVAYRIESERPQYAVDIVYIGLMNQARRTMAFALNPRIELIDAEGRVLSSRRALGWRQLYEIHSSPEAARSYGIIPIEVELVSEGQIRAAVWMGCRRNIAERPAAEIAARNALLALVALAVVLCVTTLLVSRLTRPLERLSAVAGQLAEGAPAPLVAHRGRDEVGRIAQSLSKAQEGLRAGRLWQRSAARLLAQEIDRPLPGPVGAPYMLVQVSDLIADERRERLLAASLEAGFAHDGELLGGGGGVALMAWGVGGEEADDCLRALMAAGELRRALAEAGFESCAGSITLGRLGAQGRTLAALLAEHGRALSEAGASGPSPPLFVHRDLAALARERLGEGESPLTEKAEEGSPWLSVDHLPALRAFAALVYAPEE